jgi:hypothetical protein
MIRSGLFHQSEENGMIHPNQRRWMLLSGFVVLALAVLACSVPDQETAPTAVTTATAAVGATSQPTPIPLTATTAPAQAEFTATPAPATATAAPDVSFQGVSFSFDHAIASDAWGQVIEATPPTDDMPGFDISPQHIEFSFKNYVLQNTFHTPQIYVYPAREFAAMSEAAKSTVDEFPGFLQQAQPAPEHIPFLPIWNAAQVMRTNVAYLPFQNGKGVRFVSYYAQSAAVINNHSLFYTYQGLTDDGNYYVSIVLPVSNPSLPADDSQIPGGDYEAFANQYMTYLDGVVQGLNAQPNESFTPNLALLDEMVRSVEIK